MDDDIAKLPAKNESLKNKLVSNDEEMSEKRCQKNPKQNSEKSLMIKKEQN